MGKPGSLYIRVPDDITIEKLQAWVEAKSKRPWTLWKIQVADDSKTSTNNIVQVKMNAPDSRRGAKTA